MENELLIFVIALIVLTYGFFSKALEKFNISGPMIFMFLGVLLSPLVFGLTNLKVDETVVEIIAEIALILVLFTDASSLNIEKLRREWRLSVRLLFIGLPLTIVFASGVAILFFIEESNLYLLLMALILAPTDAALGKAVVLDNRVPEKIRSCINVESGLNDGIVFPMFITVLLLITSGSQANNSWFMFLVEQISLGFIFGAISGFVGAKVLSKAMEKNWIFDTYKNLSPVSLAILSFYIAEHFGGNGFIAAYISGLIFGNFSDVIDEKVESFLEGQGEILILISFLVFGLTFIPATYLFWDMKVFIYSLLSLTVFRMIPVALSLSGLKLSLSTKLFIGWFGPRGIASILYIMIAVHNMGGIKGHETIFSVLTLSILLSIILHGLSARPLAVLYSKKDI